MWWLTTITLTLVRQSLSLHYENEAFALWCLKLQAKISNATTAQHAMQHWPIRAHCCTVHLLCTLLQLANPWLHAAWWVCRAEVRVASSLITLQMKRFCGLHHTLHDRPRATSHYTGYSFAIAMGSCFAKTMSCKYIYEETHDLGRTATKGKLKWKSDWLWKAVFTQKLGVKTQTDYLSTVRCLSPQITQRQIHNKPSSK